MKAIARTCCLLLLSAAAVAQSPKPYQYFRIGNASDITAPTKAGFALVGGGEDLDEAFRWMCMRSGGGDFLILRATGTDAYNPYVQKLCHQNSVATLVIPTRAAAQDPAVAQIISKAEAIFISGGDQSNYINFWKGTPVQSAINAAAHRGVPIGGTSAGLAVQGEFIYSAQNDLPDSPNFDSKMALANPFHHQLVIARGLIDDPLLTNTITDSHFVTRDRMGRLLTMMARILDTGSTKNLKAIGIDEQTAVLLEPNGDAAVVGKGSAYFLRASTKPATLELNMPLTFGPVDAVKLSAGGTFDLPAWKGSAPAYTYTVNSGAVHSSRSAGLY